MDGWNARLALLAALTLPVACSTIRYSQDYDPQATFSRYRTYDWIMTSEDEQAALERINPFLERRLQRAVEGEMAQRGFELTPAAEPDLLVSVYPIVPERDEQTSGRARGRGPGSSVHVSVGFGFGFGRPYGYGYRYPYFGYPYSYFGYPYSYFGYPLGWGFGYPHFAIAFPIYGYGYGWRPAYGGGYYSAGGYGYSSPVALDGLAAGTLVVDVVDARTRELVWRGWAEGAFYDMPRPDQLSEYVGEVVGKMMKGFPPPDEGR